MNDYGVCLHEIEAAWDEIKYLSGYRSDYCVITHPKGQKWSISQSDYPTQLPERKLRVDVALQRRQDRPAYPICHTYCFS